ncbi:MAG: two-component sensor histidine kinase [Anaerofustis stercorihominis]|nr:two-component sensor histidine kinase [Anaerofustis stercorihominis]
MTERIFRSVVTAVLITLLCSLVIIAGVFNEYYTDMQSERLRVECRIASVGIKNMGVDYLDGIRGEDFRVCLYDTAGYLIYDTGAEYGIDERMLSDIWTENSSESSAYLSFTEKVFFYAQRVSETQLLVVSASQPTMPVMIMGMIQPLLFVLLIAAILCTVFANSISKKIVDPLNELDLDNPLENEVYKELKPLMRRIDSLSRQIDQQMSELKRKNDEFTMITSNMSEAIILLNEREVVVSMNPSGYRLFGLSEDCTGRMFITIDRNREIREAVRIAFETGHSDVFREINDRFYQFDISRISHDGKIAGAVILAVDVTEQALAQKARREFTANVSHELKSPLQSIMGSAELIEKGIVKEEDMPRFIGHIRTESARLLSLIEDIMRLSQLDEQTDMQREEVNIYEVAEETVCLLEDVASARKVNLELEGDECVIPGVRRLVSEIIYNLCENAIKYNVEGGKVFIGITEGMDNVTLSVRDTGIGIDKKHHSRIFERFYRVDKSHSKQTGGTGLGLSIVKHAALYHNAKINIDSEPGKGTVIEVVFPK